MKTFDQIRENRFHHSVNEAYVDDVPSKAMSKGLDSRGSGGKGGLAKIHQHHADAAAAHDAASKTKRQDLGVIAAHKKAADSHRSASAALKAGNHQAAIDHGKKAREHSIAIHNSPHGGTKTTKAAHQATSMAVNHHNDEAKYTRQNHRDEYSRMSTGQKIKHKLKRLISKEGYDSVKIEDKMKTLNQIREEADLLEMEIFTHKKKIAATHARVQAARQKHADAAQKHYDHSSKAWDKHAEKHYAKHQTPDNPHGHQTAPPFKPNLKSKSYHDIKTHVDQARYHKAAASGQHTTAASLAGVRDQHRSSAYDQKHISSKDIKHSEKIHKELVDAHAAHKAALKNRPVAKLKRAVGMSEMKSSEVGRDDLKDGGRNRNHNGHEGGAAYHKSMADEHKGTAAGKLHAKAADHHSNALAALNKGNISSSHEHSKLAAATAKKAQAAGGAKSDSSEVHYSHSQHYRHHQRNQTTQNIKNKEKRAGVQDKPVQRAIGKIKSKVKKAFQREEVTHLSEMEMLTHKKKIAAAAKKLKVVQQKHKAMADKHFNLADKAKKKHGSDDHVAVKAHIHKGNHHLHASEHGGPRTQFSDKPHPTVSSANAVKAGTASDSRFAKHYDQKDVKHAMGIHKELVKAHADHDAAKKNRPVAKMKRAIGMKEESTSEGYVSMAQQRAVWAGRKDGGKGHPDNKRKRKKEDVGEVKSADKKPEKYIGADGKTKIRMVPVVREQDSDAVKAFLAKGGKIKKLPPAKAQGYHGRDDPGKDMHGMMDRPDTKQMGTRKKVKSMEANQVDEISKDTKKRYIKKAADDMSRQADRMARAQRGDGKMDKAVNKFVNRRKGIARALEAKETDPPFDDAKKISTTPAKDQFGNIIKNRAKHLARQAAKKAGGDMGDKK